MYTVKILEYGIPMTYQSGRAEYALLSWFTNHLKKKDNSYGAIAIAINFMVVFGQIIFLFIYLVLIKN